MLKVTSSRKWRQTFALTDEYMRENPYLYDAWRNRSDIGPDFVAPQETVPLKQEFQPTNQMNVRLSPKAKNWFEPPKDAQGNPDPNASPFLWKPRSNDYSDNIIRWIWHPVSGDFILGENSEIGQHSSMMPSRSEMENPPKFQEWVRGFWIPREKKIIIRPYFNPNSSTATWDEEAAEINARVTQQIESLLRAHLEPLVGELIIMSNATGPDVQRMTGWRRV